MSCNVITIFVIRVTMSQVTMAGGGKRCVHNTL